jgi:hypothetical protein
VDHIGKRNTGRYMDITAGYGCGSSVKLTKFFADFPKVLREVPKVLGEVPKVLGEVPKVLGEFF